MHPDRYRVRPIALALFLLVLAACGSGGGGAPEATADAAAEPAAQVVCELSGPSSEFPVRAVPGLDAAPTSLDGVNTGSCTFPEPVDSIRVTLTHVEGPLAGSVAHLETLAVPRDRVVEFPVAPRGEIRPLSSLLPLGRYARLMEAVAPTGAVYEVQTAGGEVATDVFMVDAPNATAMNLAGRDAAGG